MGRWNTNNKSQDTSSSKGRWTSSYNEDGDNESSRARAFQLFGQMMIEKIKSFKGHWEQPWFDPGLKIPRAIYGKKYHGMNAVMLMLLCEKKGYKIPVFATRGHIFAMNFKNNNRKVGEHLLDENGNKREFVHILKDSKSFPVFESKTTVTHKKTGEEIPYSDYRELTLEEKQDYKTRYNSWVYPVYNVEQTNIKDARPEIWEKLCKEYDPSLGMDTSKNKQEQIHIAPLDYMIENDQWYCPIMFDQKGGAYYNPSKNFINFPVRERFTAKGDNGESFYGNLLHEIGHSTGHKGILNRPGVNGDALEADMDRKKIYGTEELIAELTTAVLMRDLGYSSYIEKDSVPYLKDWLENIKADPEYIRKVLTDVRSASFKINEKMNEVRKIMVEEDICDDEERAKIVGMDFDDDGIVEADEIDIKDNDDREHRHRSAIRM